MTSRGASWLLTVMAGVAWFAAHSPVEAQSLADVATREAERRGHTSSGRVYTNDDLVPVANTTPPPTLPAAPLPGESPAAASALPGVASPDKTGGTSSAQEPLKAPEKRDEQYWRTRARELRGQLAKVEADMTAVEAQLAALAQAPQTPGTLREREVVAAALSRLQDSVRYRRDELVKFEALRRAAAPRPSGPSR